MGSLSTTSVTARLFSFNLVCIRSIYQCATETKQCQTVLSRDPNSYLQQGPGRLVSYVIMFVSDVPDALSSPCARPTAQPLVALPSFIYIRSTENTLRYALFFALSYRAYPISYIFIFSAASKHSTDCWLATAVWASLAFSGVSAAVHPPMKLSMLANTNKEPLTIICTSGIAVEGKGRTRLCQNNCKWSCKQECG